MSRNFRPMRQTQSRSYYGRRICPKCGHEIMPLQAITFDEHGFLVHDGNCPQNVRDCRCPRCRRALYDRDYRPKRHMPRVTR